MNRTTIKDLVKALDLTVSTISRALSDHPNMYHPTKEKVTVLAKKWGYKPNILAKNFRNNDQGGCPDCSRIEFVFCSLAYPCSLGSFGRGRIQPVATQFHRVLGKEIENIQKCEAYRVDGILISVTSHTKKFNHLLDIVNTDVPIVQFDRVIPEAGVKSVVLNDHDAAKHGTELLIDHGINNIYGAFGPSTLEISKCRSAGFQSAMTKAKLPNSGKIFFLQK